MKKLIYTILFLYGSSVFGVQNFTTFQNNLALLPENVENSNDDWENPNYVDFYKKNRKTWVDSLLQYMHLSTEDPWGIEHIESALHDILKQRWWHVSQKEDFKKGQFWVRHIVAKPGTKFIIWGDLFGGVHSLFRGLEYLRSHGIIDDTLKIVNPDYYFIFLGNAINRSPYSLEILFVICSLMLQNPDQVLYFAGKHENFEYWRNLNLHRQIAVRYSNNLNEINNFETLLQNYFISLPLGLYITQQDSTRNIICLSNQIPDYYLDSVTFNSFFASTNRSITNFSSQSLESINFVPVKKVESEVIKLTAIIKGRGTLQTSLNGQGLALELPHNNATVWSVLSSQTPLYQKFAHFYQDSFVELAMGKSITQATVQLFSQDIRTKEGFKAGPLLNVITGQALYGASHAKQDTYLVGSTMPLTKSGFFMGVEAKVGMNMAIEESNQENFLHGHSVTAMILDDQYNASKALENIKKLMADYSIQAILSPVGSPTLAGYLDLVKSGQISVFFPLTGSTFFRHPEYTHMVHWRPSYDDEARVLIEYMISKKRVRKIAFFYQNDAYGLSPLAAAHELLKAKGITDWVDVPYNQQDANFTAAADAIRKARPDAIALFSIPAPTKKLFSLLGNQGLIGKKLFAISGMQDSAFRQYLQERGINVLFTEVVPNPRNSTIEIVKNYRAVMDIKNLKYDVFGLEAYITTWLYLEALRSVGDSATMDKLIAYFEAFNNVTYKGLRMTFDPATRSLSRSLWLREDEDNWQEITIPLKQQSQGDPKLDASKKHY